MPKDGIFRLASMSKPITAVAMQTSTPALHRDFDNAVAQAIVR